MIFEQNFCKTVYSKINISSAFLVLLADVPNSDLHLCLENRNNLYDKTSMNRPFGWRCVEH